MNVITVIMWSIHMNDNQHPYYLHYDSIRKLLAGAAASVQNLMRHNISFVWRQVNDLAAPVAIKTVMYLKVNNLI